MAQRINSSPGLLMNVHLDEPVLPKEGESNILVTSALPYCNNVPHLGNIIGSILSADVFSRYTRTRNRRTLFICGTDEYGTATETRALKEGIEPQALCDKYHLLHKEIYEWFDIGFDYFGRTSTPQHSEVCQEVFLNIHQNSLLEKHKKEQTYCETCQKFLADRFVEGTCPHCLFNDARGDQCDSCSRVLDVMDLINPRCHVSSAHKVTTRLSWHMYIKLDSVQPQLETWMKNSWKAGAWSQNPVVNSSGNIVDPRVKAGLKPAAITRDLKWGVKVPDVDDDMKEKVLYVWFDAPLGYPSITATYTPQWKQWWFNQKNVKLYQFMGKDNAYFHTVYFPGMLLADGRDWTTLHHLSVTEHLNYESGKFSKSRNIGVFGPTAKETGVPVSVWRYCLLSSRPETADSTFSWAELIAGNNSVLLNNFGNFVNRVVKFIVSKYQSLVPESEDQPGPLPTEDDVDDIFISEVNNLLASYIEAMESVKLRLGLHIIMQISARGNTYLQQCKLGNSLLANTPNRCAQVISRALNLIYLLSALVHPFMPSTSTSILEQLNAPPRTVPIVFGTDLLAGHTVGKPAYLFKKIEETAAEGWRIQYGGRQSIGKDATVGEQSTSEPGRKKTTAGKQLKKGSGAK